MSAFRSVVLAGGLFFESGASSESNAVEHKFGCDCPNSLARWFLDCGKIERERMPNISLKFKL